MKNIRDFITIGTLYKINSNMVKKYGGAGIGFINKNLALSVIEGCNQEVFGVKLYPTTLSKINHLVYGIIANHIFIDANKRTATMCFNLLIQEYNIELMNDFDIFEYIVGIGSSKFTEKESLEYLLSNLKE